MEQSEKSNNVNLVIDAENPIPTQPAEVTVSVEEKSFRNEFEKRLDEIGEKFKGELTDEQKKQKKLELLKLQKEAMEQFNKVWNSLSREKKRSLTKPGLKFSNRLMRNLKVKPK